VSLRMPVSTLFPYALVSRRRSLPVVCSVALSLLAGACADDSDLTPGAGAADDTGADAGADVACEGSTCSDVIEPPTCVNGIDANQDGICDRLSADWSEGAVVPEGGRADIYRLGGALPVVASNGLRHTLIWPIDVSGALLPGAPMRTMFNPDSEDETVLATQQIARGALGFGTSEEMYDWLGLARLDETGEAIPGGIVWPDYVAAGDALGAGYVDTEWGDALTFSCATCHTAELFGHTVVGLTNRTARANEFFHLAAGFFPSITTELFQSLTGANETELELFLRTQTNLAAIGSVVPQVLGLDTSLAQVSLSLARRNEDAYATHNVELQRNPRENDLETFVADSKPAVWWTLKYKNRWLSDGSIVSGNPIFTNFLWNEIGRGTDLQELEVWLQENQQIVDELTVLAFATQAPRWTEILDEYPIDIEAAQRGQVHFETMCSSCHGTYEKGWDLADASSMPFAEQLATVSVAYHEQTPVLDVGTDLQRAQGMAAFADRLNELAISNWMETVVEVQAGYVPPPLDGVFARYPYLHNGSIPNLCELLTPGAQRRTSFWMGPADNAATDFDSACVGYPVGDATPESWTQVERAFYDNTLPGLSNLGHDSMLVDSDGDPVLDEAQRNDLIEYLKTL
jgi:mono/diheme cytochrome c family protein